ncbi:MAG TPA: winged helix-turn-helix domain-containing protein [Myxococcota bacterium]|nr:winged helix-turn-helix domain-containing protein [Myxococcota bacterium]
MLEYLVRSNARRGLLLLLWRDNLSGCVSDLARRAGLSFSAVHRELEEMQAAGLAVSVRMGKKVVYRANRDHHLGGLLSELLATAIQTPMRGQNDREEHDRVMKNLKWLGLPLSGRSLSARDKMNPEEALARALVLAHRDPSLAKALPVLVYKLCDELDWNDLLGRSRELRELRALGFFLQLAGQLSGRDDLKTMASSLHDGRERKQRNFFQTRSGEFYERLAKINTPEIAGSWNYIINMPLESFRSFFEKHVGTSVNQ